METRPGRALAIAVVVLLFLQAPIFPAAAEYSGGTPHSHFQLPESCPRCHIPDRAGRPDPARLSPDSDALCLDCHRKGNLGRTHPTGVRPADWYGKGKIPGDLRLADDGRMICLTCHTAHGTFFSSERAFPNQKPEDPAIGKFRTFFLRRSGPETGAAPLCEACHRMPR